MRYLGMDVHAKSTVWCLLDEQGAVLRRGGSHGTSRRSVDPGPLDHRRRHPETARENPTS
jgi:hypothetical protein